MQLLSDRQETRMEQAENSTQPWFRMPIMWLVLGIPLSAVLVGGVMLTLSIVSFDGLVDDDYYRKGLGINQRLDRIETARTLGLTSAVELDGASGAISVDLSANPGFIFSGFNIDTSSSCNQVESRLQRDPAPGCRQSVQWGIFGTGPGQMVCVPGNRRLGAERITGLARNP